MTEMPWVGLAWAYFIHTSSGVFSCAFSTCWLCLLVRFFHGGGSDSPQLSWPQQLLEPGERWTLYPRSCQPAATGKAWRAAWVLVALASWRGGSVTGGPGTSTQGGWVIPGLRETDVSTRPDRYARGFSRRVGCSSFDFLLLPQSLESCLFSVMWRLHSPALHWMAEWRGWGAHCWLWAQMPVSHSAAQPPAAPVPWASLPRPPPSLPRMEETG